MTMSDDKNLMRGPVSLDELVTVEAVYDPRERWNGFLCPRLDRQAVETVMAAFPDDEPESPSHRWDGDVLIVSEDDGSDPYSTRVQPDTDGLYALGAQAWIWTGDESRATAVSAREVRAAGLGPNAPVVSLDERRAARNQNGGEDA